jgi:hypothetical protein
MRQFARSVPVILFLSIASLSLIALAGCGSSGSGNLGPTAAKSIYAIQRSNNGDTEQDSVLVFSASATGTTTVTPTSTLMLPSNFEGISVAVGPTGTIYVGGVPESDDVEFGQILEYPAGSSGSATPTVTLNGSSAGTTTFMVPLNMAVNSAGTLVVSSSDGTLEAFASGFTASTPPSQYLTWGPATNPNTGGTNFSDPFGSIGVDTAGDIFYGDYGELGNGVGEGVIDVFAAGATKATAPTRQITGTNTNSFYDLEYMAVDGAGDVYVANYNEMNDSHLPTDETKLGTYAASKSLLAMGWRGANRLMAHPHVVAPTYEPTEIIEFAAGATGNATPAKRIGGTATNIVEPLGLAVDAASNLYYADANGDYYAGTTPPPSVLLEVFPSSAIGNVAPAASITSTSYTYTNLSFPPPSFGFLLSGVAIH